MGILNFWLYWSLNGADKVLWAHKYWVLPGEKCALYSDSFLPAVNITKNFLLGKLSPQISNLFLKILQW